MQFRPMTRAEQKYCFAQSFTLNHRTGLIGYLRGDFGSGGKSFHTTFFDVNTDLKTRFFRREFDAVINNLRENESLGLILSSRRSMAAFCESHPDSEIPGERQYGYRIDCNGYVYLLRANPVKGDYNFYVYCYVQEHFDKHLTAASDGIRFVGLDYETLFYLPDGEKVCVTLKCGESKVLRCRYIDAAHFQANDSCGASIYHIFEFADLMAQNGCSGLKPATDGEGA